MEKLFLPWPFPPGSVCRPLVHKRAESLATQDHCSSLSTSPRPLSSQVQLFPCSVLLPPLPFTPLYPECAPYVHSCTTVTFSPLPRDPLRHTWSLPSSSATLGWAWTARSLLRLGAFSSALLPSLGQPDGFLQVSGHGKRMSEAHLVSPCKSPLLVTFLYCPPLPCPAAPRFWLPCLPPPVCVSVAVSCSAVSPSAWHRVRAE